MKLSRWVLGVAAVSALIACDQMKGDSGGSGSKCKSDGDCKNGFLCESDTCVPAEVAKKARGAGTAKATATATAKEGVAAATTADATKTAAAKEAECGDPSKVPEIPSTRSDPPKGPEWDGACQINTQGANAWPDDCNMRILREWIMVTCRGDILGYEKMESFGSEGLDYFKQIQPGQMASFAVRLVKGRNQKVRICRKKDRASLFVSWPPSKDRPLHVALGKGPQCDGGDWGSAHKKK